MKKKRAKRNMIRQSKSSRKYVKDRKTKPREETSVAKLGLCHPVT